MNATVTVPLHNAQFPGENLAAEAKPFYWLLASLGKRALRPGGLELTRDMLRGLRIGPADDLVEFAPGLGTTARIALPFGPASYTGVDRDADALHLVQGIDTHVPLQLVKGTADHSTLDDQSASVVWGEAMLTMQPDKGKERIAAEAFRILKPGGRYGIHELAIVPDEISPSRKNAIRQDLSESSHVGTRPMTVAEWRALLTDAGFEVIEEYRAPLRLLNPVNIAMNEGLRSLGQLAWGLVSNAPARRRVLAMHAAFGRHKDALGAVSLVAQKPA